MDNSISLNKFISDSGYCSRREADDLIKTGRVLLNNKTARLGNRFTPGDQVEVDGSLITAAKKEKSVYLVFNKPLGITTTTEEHVKGNIISFIGFPKRIFPIGRLDKDSEGLIFLTNDGDIVNKLLRAGNAHEKEYTVRVNKPIEPGFAEQMAAGIPMLDTVTLPCKVKVTGRQRFNIILTQGLNRQIRRMCEYMGYAVESLQRIRIMSVKLDKLAAGKWRYLSDTEIKQLMESIKDSSGEEVRTKARKKPAPGPSTFSPAKKGPSASRKEPGPRDKSRFRSEATEKPTKTEKAKQKTAARKSSKPVDAGPKKTEAKSEAPKKEIGKYKAFREKGRKR